MSSLVYGVGVNDSSYVVKTWDTFKIPDGSRKYKTKWSCPFYTRWKGMLERCYSASRKPSYADCRVCDEWLTFSCFKNWMEKQDWQGNELDKDILSVGNQLYSPETCLFVSPRVNTFITDRKRDRGDLPIGVSRGNGRFRAFCSKDGVVETLGTFDTPEIAHMAWLSRKIELAIGLAALQTDTRVAEALVLRYTNYSQS